MGFESISSGEYVSTIGSDLKALRKHLKGIDMLQDTSIEDRVCKKLEENTSVQWYERFPQTIPNDIIGVQPPKQPGGFKTATFELSELSDIMGEVFAYVSIGYIQRDDGSVYVSRKVSFKVGTDTRPRQYTPTNQIHQKLMYLLEENASNFLPKEDEKPNEHTGRSIGVIHYLPNT